MSVSQSEDEFFDGIDWEDKIVKKDALIKKMKENTTRLKKDVIAMKEVLKKDSEIRKLQRKAYEIDRAHDDLRQRCVRDRKRLQWFERREEDESARQMEKKINWIEREGLLKK